jgi:hypothetical protein
MNYRDVLIEDLNKSIIIVSHREIYKFITLNPKYTQQEIVQDQSNYNVVRAFNLFTSCIETIPVAEIVEHLHRCFEDPIENDRIILEILDWLNDKINLRLSDPKNTFSKLELYHHISRKHVINVENIHLPNYIFEFLYNCDFIVDVDDLLLNEVPEDKREKIVNACKKLIQLKIDEITDELNTLKLQSDSEEDITDIDTIIQMYRDVVDDIDLTSCKTLTEYFKNWPPLLLPLPEYIDKFLHKIETHNCDDSYTDFMRIVDDMLSVEEIKELLDELETLQPTNDEMIIISNDLTPFKQYLRYKLNNEHK